MPTVLGNVVGQKMLLFYCMLELLVRYAATSLSGEVEHKFTRVPLLKPSCCYSEADGSHHDSNDEPWYVHCLFKCGLSAD